MKDKLKKHLGILELKTEDEERLIGMTVALLTTIIVGYLFGILVATDIIAKALN